MIKLTTGLLLAFLLLTGCKSPASKDALTQKVFRDPGGRVVTVERWASVAGYAKAWAIYPDKVIVFARNDFGKPEILIAEQSIAAPGLAQIKEEIQRLPAGLRGKHFSKEGVHDGVFFRISFSSRGALTSNRIEFENMHLPGVAPLLAAIDAQVPSEHAIHYEDMIASRFNDRMTKVEKVEVP